MSPATLTTPHARAHEPRLLACRACRRWRSPDELLRVECVLGHGPRDCLIGLEAFVCRPTLDACRGCVRRVVGSSLVHRITPDRVTPPANADTPTLADPLRAPLTRAVPGARQEVPTR